LADPVAVAEAVLRASLVADNRGRCRVSVGESCRLEMLPGSQDMYDRHDKYEDQGELPQWPDHLGSCASHIVITTSALIHKFTFFVKYMQRYITCC
jgi:hypothetical protein